MGSTGRIVLIFVFVAQFFSGSAQIVNNRWTIGIKFMGLSTHLKKNPHPHLYRYKLDSAGITVFNLGMVVIVDYNLSAHFSIRASQALIPSDCAGKFLGATQFAISYGQSIGRWNGRISMGPLWFYRRSWENLPGYIDEGLFAYSKNRTWQKKFVWYGGEVEVNYQLNDNKSLSMNIMPGIPELFAFSPGIKFQ